MNGLPAANGRRVLVVDDDPAIALVLGQLLEHEGYRIARASDGREALARAAEFRPDLVLLDLDMPHLGGYEVCRRLKQDPSTQLLPILILTGQSSSEARLRAWDLGADDFLTKPFQSVDVRARCRSLLRLKGLVDELDSAQAVVFAFARAVEAKSPYTQGHAERVNRYALALAGRLCISPAEQAVLHEGAILHDIGKIWVPDAILDKPGPLTPEEFDLIKQHPMQGVRIVEPLRSIREAIPLIRWHHERPDGRGYPDGLAGDAIPLLVRILSVADVYDALASDRPYRPALDHVDCLAELRRIAADGGLDPDLVRDFAEAVKAPCSEAKVAPRARLELARK
jgi:putative two-component system response regulator